MPRNIKDVRPGDVVLLERYPQDVGSDGKPLSGYNGGEYIVYDITEWSIGCIGVPKGGVYGLHEMRRMHTVGQDRWAITAIRSGKKDMQRAIEIAEQGVVERDGGKPQWVRSVYDCAIANAERLRAILQERYDVLVKPAEKAADELPARMKCGTWVVVDGVLQRVASGARLVVESVVK